jgi:uncharacterized protein (TIGR00369 family)
MRAVPHTRGCFVCGESNPIGLRLKMQTDGRLVQTRFVPRNEHVGFKQTMHGGLVGTLLDEVMAWACAVYTRRFAYCAELNVRFLLPVRPEVEIIIRGEVVENRRNKLFEAKSEIQDLSGNFLARATGKYLPVKREVIVDMTDDLVGDSSYWLKSD